MWIDVRASDRFCGNSCGPSPQRERRTSGPENFQSSAKTDFFNTMLSFPDVEMMYGRTGLVCTIDAPLNGICEN
jgi:hypothetical protein